MTETVEVELDDLHELAAMSLKDDDADMDDFCEEVLKGTLYDLYQRQE